MIVDNEGNIILKNDTEGKHVIQFINDNLQNKRNIKILPYAIACITIGLITFLVLLRKRRKLN